MKKTIFISSLIFLLTQPAIAQKRDSVLTSPWGEKGTAGDVILGKEKKQRQLSDTPEKVQTDNWEKKKDVHHKKRKAKNRK